MQALIDRLGTSEAASPLMQRILMEVRCVQNARSRIEEQRAGELSARDFAVSQVVLMCTHEIQEFPYGVKDGPLEDYSLAWLLHHLLHLAYLLVECAPRCDALIPVAVQAIWTQLNKFCTRAMPLNLPGLTDLAAHVRLLREAATRRLRG
jgi:hypothetical protein